jgi:hypothetical protein
MLSVGGWLMSLSTPAIQVWSMPRFVLFPPWDIFAASSLPTIWPCHAELHRRSRRVILVVDGLCVVLTGRYYVIMPTDMRLLRGLDSDVDV